MSILFTFPGQGSQRAGMLHALPSGQPIRDTIAEASDTLATDVLSLDSAEALQSAVAVQLALAIAGVAMARQLIAEAGPPDAVAGLSIGAYPAAVVAGVLGFADALRLVDTRARLMQAAYPSGYGMTAILGLDEAALQPLIDQVHGPHSPVYLANLNAPTQLVISGSTDARARVAELALARGAHAAKPIAIGVPSHCPLLDGPAAELALAFAEVPMSPPRLRYFSASMARELRDPARIGDDLARNMARRVRWHDTMTLARERGVGLCVEMPPGSVLTRLATVALPQSQSISADETLLDTLSLLVTRERLRQA